jgi:hypothetical protein
MAMDRKSPGTGNWAHWSLPLEAMFQEVSVWEQQLKGVEKPWLCWNISDRWCITQQNLVKSVGWTPLVGWDPRVGPPPLVDGAIAIDFNKNFKFEEMRPHFVFEWVFRFAPRMAFWHSDLLVRPEVMKHLAEVFESLKDGEMAAVNERLGLRDIIFDYRGKRYWELAACTTRGASKSQFDCGTGWWRNFSEHPNCPPAEKKKRAKYSYEFGVAILYWKKHCGGIVKELDQKPLDEGHCTGINNKNYVHLTENKSRLKKYAELDLNFDLDEVAKRLGISQYVPAPVD